LVPERHAPLRQSVFTLRHVLDLDLVERETDLLDDVRAAARITPLDNERGHAPVLDRDLQVFKRALASLPQRQHGFLDRLIRSQRAHQCRGSAVNAFHDLQVVHGGFPCCDSALQAASSLHPPRPTRHLDLALVLVVLRFALDHAMFGALDHQEHVARAAAHGALTFEAVTLVNFVLYVLLLRGATWPASGPEVTPQPGSAPVSLPCCP
jgi:hypothetical protein